MVAPIGSKELIISVKEAKKLLGKNANSLTNEELVDLITQTETVVRFAVRQYIGSKNDKNHDNLEVERS